MQINLPSKVRKAVYIMTAVCSPVMAYLNTAGTVSDFWFGLYAVVMTAVATLAAVNTDTSE